MNPEITAILKGQKHEAEELASWEEGNIELRIRSYVCDKAPPLDYVTSVRCVLLLGKSVLVIQSTDGTFHVLPGGRREGNGTIEETLRREVLEEAGWTINQTQMLGFMHFQHMSPKPAEYKYPYPDFFQLVFNSQPEKPRLHRKPKGEWEQASYFINLDEINSLRMSPYNVLYLRKAIELMTVADA